MDNEDYQKYKEIWDEIEKLEEMQIEEYSKDREILMEDLRNKKWKQIKIN